jgi:isopentenyl-diphosphate delta-isomerase
MEKWRLIGKLFAPGASIFIFNGKGEMLLQQRSKSKYHSAGWTNACDLKNGEEIREAALRLNEELGFNTDIEKLFDFIYQASFDNGLTEYEFDHVFAGTNGDISDKIVSDYCFKSSKRSGIHWNLIPKNIPTGFNRISAG